MPRKKSNDTPEVKALRKLLLSLGLSAVTANHLIRQTEGCHADLSAKACEIEMYIAAHPEVKNPSGYAATTLKNFVTELAAPPIQYVAVAQQPPSIPSPPSTPATMELWGEEEL